MVIYYGLSLPNLIAIYLASDRIISPLVNAIDIYSRLISTSGVVRKLEDIIVGAVDSQGQGEKVKEILPLKIRGLNFSYGEKKIYENLDLNIEKGNKILILGESGSGKSTLFKLITRKIPPQQDMEIMYADKPIFYYSSSDIYKYSLLYSRYSGFQ